VDDAIVVLENIHRHLEMGKSRWQATLDATKEIGITVASITIVLVTVFLPIGLIPGTTGQVLRSFSLVIVIAILVSLLVSFTLVPLLTSRFDKLKKLDREKPFDRFLLAFESMINWCKSAVLYLTRWALGHKFVTIATAIALLISSILLVSGGFIQTDFMDAGDRGEFIVSMELDRTAPLEQTSGMCLNIEKMMLTYPEITTVYTKVGTKGGTMTFLETPYAAEFNVKLVPKDQRKLSSKLFSKKLQNDLGTAFAGPKFKVSEVSMLGTTSSPLMIYVQSNDFEKAKKYSQFVVDELRDIEGTVDIESTIEAGNKEIVVKFDREKLAKMGLTIGEIGSQMYILYEGNRDLKYRDGTNEYDIYISLDEFDRKSKNDVENISFMNHSGQLVKLSQVADIVEGESPSTLIRYNKMPSVMITGNMVGKTIGTVGDEIKERIEKSDKPADVNVVYGGTMESQSDSFASLGLAFLASIILMYLTMVALYDSYVYPLVVMLSLPLSIIGALLALALSGKTLSIFSIMGIIMLMGLVAKNAILVVDFANNAQEKGKKAIDAIIEATSVRFRPILMTNLALIVGMLPIALGSGAGAEWKNGLGWVLIGGLISSMVLSFIIVPVLYIIFNKLVMKRKQVYIKDESVKKETLEVIPN